VGRPGAGRAHLPGDRSDAGLGVALDVGQGIGDGQPGAADKRGRDEHEEQLRDPARRAQPGEHRQQRDPEGERQPRPGSPAQPQVVEEPHGEDRHGDDPRREARRQAQDEPHGGRNEGQERGRGRPDETGREGLAQLPSGVARDVDEVVDRADRGLEGDHRGAQPEGVQRPAAGEQGDGERGPAVEEGRKRVAQPNEAGQPSHRRGRGRGRPAPPVALDRPVRRRRARRS
jgi:hypothetical protein